MRATTPPSHSSFRPDVSLQARMVLTMLLLGLLYVAFVGALLSAGASVVTMALVVCGLALAQLFLTCAGPPRQAQGPGLTGLNC